MNFNYLEKLILEYKRIYNIEKFNYYNTNDFEKFNDWLLSLKINSNRYRQFILNNILKDLNNTVEFSKGEYDTITNYSDSNILVTPYANSFKNIGSRQLVSGDVFVSDDVVVQLNNNLGKVSFKMPNAFLIQNPTNQDNMLGYTLIKHDYPVIIGVYGSTYDNDYKNKLRNLEAIIDNYRDLNVIENNNLETKSVVAYTKKLIK